MEEGGDIHYILTGERTPTQLREDRAGYLSPARDLAERIAMLQLSMEDADMVYQLAARLAGNKG